MKPALVLATVLLSLLSSDTLAANVVFSDGPEFTDGGKLLIVSGSLAGLDDRDARIRVNATGVARVVFRNSQGKIAGKNRTVPAVINFDQTISREMIARGHAAFFLTSGTPQVDPRLTACERPGWTSTIEDVTFRSATITITQGGAVVLRQDFRP